MIRRFRSLLPILALLAAIPLAATAAENLPRDDQNVYGKFDNGLSYIIRHNQNPPGRVAMYLHFKSGALNESETQNGLAHFLEHMAFNGSAHFPPGELVPYLNKMGMQFGADTNAHTNHEETVYKLLMPDNKDETVDKALTIFADYTGGLLLQDDEINNERKVILEESRAHKSAMERLQKEMMRKVFAGTRIAVHDVIGDEDQIAAFPRSEFTDYWNSWYRPELATLIVVGDIDANKIIAKAKALLAGIKPRVPARTALKAGIQPVKQPRAFVFADKEQVMGMVRFMAINEPRPIMKTVEDYRFNELENIGTWIVSRRLDELISKGDAAFRHGGVGVSDMQHEAILPSGFAVGEPTEWNKMLEQIIVEISRALDHGFTQSELDLAKSGLIAQAQRALETEPTIDARAMIGRIAGAIGQDEPLLSAKQRLDLLNRLLPDVTLDQVLKVFVDNFKTKFYTYTLFMPESADGLKLPKEDEILAAANEAWAKKTQAPKQEKQLDSILASQPKPGKIADEKSDSDLKIATITFDNGLVMHHRFMDYKKDAVLVNITLPGGSIEETNANKGISEVAGLILDQSATSRMTSTAIRDFMTDKKVNVGGGIGLDTMSISASGSPKDLPIGLELIHALLTDGKLEKSAFDNWKKATLQQLEQMKTQPQGAIRQAMDQTLFGGDVRLTQLTPEQIEKLDVPAAQAWFDRIASTAAIEVAVVGDISLDDAKNLVSTYLGSLPKRQQAFTALDNLRKLQRGSGPYTRLVEFESITPKALALAGFVSCDESQTVDRRVLTLAARVLTDRMIKKIREEEQLVYSIGCSNQPARSMPGMGTFMAGAPTDPHNGEKLADRVLEMLKDFAANGPTAEELTTAKKQMATGLETQMKEPSFWLSQMSDRAYRGRPLDELKQLPDVFNTFTADQLRDTVAKYAKPDRLIRLIAIPQSDKKAEASEKSEAPAKVKPKTPAKL